MPVLRRFFASMLVLAGGLLLACGEEPAAEPPGAPEAATAGSLATPGGAVATAPGGAGAVPAERPAGGPAAAYDTSRLPAVVARVDGVEILRRDLLERATAMRVQMAQVGAPEPPANEEFFREMLDQVIGAHLLFAEAKERGVLPSEQEVASELAQLRGRFPTPEAFTAQLAARGLSERDLTADLTRALAIQKLVASDVPPPVSEEAERRFYEENLERMKRPEQVRVRHILVGAAADAPAADRKAARAEAEALLARLRAGEDFATLAGQSSDDPGSRSEGGLLPWLGRGETVPPFEQAAFALAPGATSGVVESPFGFHLIRLEERREPATVPFAEARPEIRELLTRRQARDQLRDRVAALRRRAKVEILF